MLVSYRTVPECCTDPAANGGVTGHRPVRRSFRHGRCFGNDQRAAAPFVVPIRSMRNCRLTRVRMSSKPILALYESQ